MNEKVGNNKKQSFDFGSSVPWLQILSSLVIPIGIFFPLYSLLGKSIHSHLQKMQCL